MSTVQKQPLVYLWKLDDNGGVVVTGCFDRRNASEIVIPAEIEGRPVVAIDAGGFESCVALKSIALPDSLETIGERVLGVLHVGVGRVRIRLATY